MSAVLLAVILSVPVASYSQVAVGISVSIAPPPLPVYTQPICPAPGYIWAPGYWAFDPVDGYYWVPGTWVDAPFAGALWTPGYWGWSGGAFLWNTGYWGPQVGFYGGINYGFGYVGVGYLGGYWNNGAFNYNQAVNNISTTNITNVYNKTVVNNITVNHVSYNGGNGGITARPTSVQLAAASARRDPPVAAQVQQRGGSPAQSRAIRECQSRSARRGGDRKAWSLQWRRGGTSQSSRGSNQSCGIQRSQESSRGSEYCAFHGQSCAEGSQPGRPGKSESGCESCDPSADNPVQPQHGGSSADQRLANHTGANHSGSQGNAESGCESCRPPADNPAQPQDCGGSADHRFAIHTGANCSGSQGNAAQSSRLQHTSAANLVQAAAQHQLSDSAYPAREYGEGAPGHCQRSSGSSSTNRVHSPPRCSASQCDSSTGHDSARARSVRGSSRPAIACSTSAGAATTGGSTGAAGPAIGEA